jgi:hypothetical protein
MPSGDVDLLMLSNDRQEHTSYQARALIRLNFIINILAKLTGNIGISGLERHHVLSIHCGPPLY